MLVISPELMVKIPENHWEVLRSKERFPSCKSDFCHTTKPYLRQVGYVGVRFRINLRIQQSGGPIIAGY